MRVYAIYFMISLLLELLIVGCIAFGPINKPPEKPHNPYPHDGAVDVDLEITLSWESSDPEGDPVTFDLYVGTKIVYEESRFGDTEPVLVDPIIVEKGLSESSYRLKDLNPNTEYYWKVTARDSNDLVSEGPLWKFTTKNTDD